MSINDIKPDGACVADVMAALEHIAPAQLAEEWDNCGLQVGSHHWPVRKIWVALDPHPAVVQQAAQQQVDMLITHHPLLFRPLRNLDVDNPIGGVLETALTSHIAIFAAHTNLDCTKGGVNDILAARIGLIDLMPLVPAATPPPDMSDTGLGRIGGLAEPTTLQQLAQATKSALNLSALKMCGDPRMIIHSVALCSGGGSSLLEAFIATDAQVFISGDLRYHDARTAEDMGRALIDVGHFSSETIVIDALAEQLRSVMEQVGLTVIVEACRIEQDPFRYL